MATRRKTPSPTSAFKFPVDEATAYAQAVVAETEMAGPHVRNACARHLKDLQSGHERGLVWSPGHVERVLKFFRKVLVLNGGDFEGKPFDPLPWQCFILGSLFGWLRLPPGAPPLAATTVPSDGIEALFADVGQCYRRFVVAYQETGKGSGKSPLAAGIGLYMMIADGESRAEVYAAATKKDQAQVLFRDAVAMVEQSTALQSRVKKSGRQPNVWNLSFLTTNSFFRPIASEDGQSGPRPSCALLDEVHEHKGPTVIEMLRAGFKFRKQPLMFMITNSGADRTSVCYDYHEYGSKVSAGALTDDTFFAYIAAHDPGEDPFDPKWKHTWKKSNPSLGHTFGEKYLEDQVTQARGMPSKESVVRRLHFCQWTQSYDPWLSNDVWDKNKAQPIPLAQLRGARAKAGLDLSSKNDLSALVLTFDHEDGTASVHPFFWVPEEGIVKKEQEDRVPYTAWAAKGLIELVPGVVIDYGFIAQKLKDLMDEYDIYVNFDRWRIQDLRREMKNLDMTWASPEEEPFGPHGQGFKDMNPSIELVEDEMKKGMLRHGDNPVLKWCVANTVVVKDPAELRKFDKARSTGRIDGAQALVMARRGPIVDQDKGGDLDDFLSNPIIVG